LGYEPSVIHPTFDDGSAAPPLHTDVPGWTIELALKKAQSLAPDHPRNGELLLSADTVVIKDREIIGKPIDAEDARRIITLLSNCDHEVLSGVALLWDGGQQTFTDTARVSVGTILEDEINNYIDSGAWQGKAGAYNLIERLEAGWPIRYQGDPSTIMGLPMYKMIEALHTLGLHREAARAPSLPIEDPL